jgi:hypothetical protein
MTQANIDYHEKVVAEVQAKYGIRADSPGVAAPVASRVRVGGPRRGVELPHGTAEEISAALPAMTQHAGALKEACEALQHAVAAAPEGGGSGVVQVNRGGGFTPARDLLSQEAAGVCASAVAEQSQIVANQALLQRMLAEAKERAEQQRQAEAQRTILAAGAACAAGWTTTSPACADGRLNADERAKCSAACQTASKAAYDTALANAGAACVAEFVEKNTSKGCALARPADATISTTDFAAALKGCADQCRTQGPVARKAHLKELADQKAAEARAAAEAARDAARAAAAGPCEKILGYQAGEAYSCRSLIAASRSAAHGNSDETRAVLHEVYGRGCDSCL